MNTLLSQLHQLNQNLNRSNWRKGSYFQVATSDSSNPDTLCMCIHGAAASVCNPRVKGLLELYKDDVKLAAEPAAAPAAVAAAGSAARSGAGAAEAAAEAKIQKGKTPQEVWNNRPDWVKRDYIRDGRNYGNLNLHFLLGMVGATTTWNDDPNTTLEMVHAKIDEAIVLAGVLGV